MKMQVRAIFLIMLMITTPLLANSVLDKQSPLKPVNYDLKINIDYDETKLFSECRLTLHNPGSKEVSQIPLLLYRLMQVRAISDENGQPIPFKQQVVSYEDWEVLQVNFIEVMLNDPVPVGENKTIIIEYDGYLRGYTETGMRYVQDTIDPQFTIIRPDCRAYPMLGVPLWKANRMAGLPTFDYRIEVTVPDSLNVANGGKLLHKDIAEGRAIYTYESIKPSWRMDIAIARYELLKDGGNKVFCFEEDAIRGEKILGVMQNTLDLYTEWFGALHDYQGFTIIEVPEGYGSQADAAAIIQTSGAFKNDDRLYELYHEFSHLWNVPSNDEISPRLEEGLACLLQYVVVEKLEQRQILTENMNQTIERLQKNYVKHPEFKNIPMIDFGKEKITDLSYRTGRLFFYIFYNLVGEQQFNHIIGSFYQKYYAQGATTQEFMDYCIKHSPVDLSNLIDDWIYGTRYVEYLLEVETIGQLVEKY